MPINSHVTSEEEKRKLQPKYSNPKRNWRRFSLRYPLSKVSSYLKLKVKYDDIMPINSHVTSEEGKRKLQPKYSNPKKIEEKKISKKNLSATFQIFSKCHFPKFSKNL